MFNLKITPEDIVERIARLQASLPQKIEEARKKLADLVMRSLRKHAPKRTGTLQSSLKWVSVGNVDVLWGVYYGKYVITGTRPHEIRPKKAKALRFEIDGKVVFAKRVNHPGTKPNDFRVRAVEEVNTREVLANLSQWLKEQVS